MNTLRINVEIWLLDASQSYKFEDVMDTYTEGGVFVVRLSEVTFRKFPLCRIESIEETEVNE